MEEENFLVPQSPTRPPRPRRRPKLRGPPTKRPAAQSEEPEKDKRIRYVALGDSICSGGPDQMFPTPPQPDGCGCLFNFKGYPENCYVGQVAKTLGLDRDHAINPGLPGLMSADLVELVQTGMSEMNKPPAASTTTRRSSTTSNRPMSSPSRWAFQRRLRAYCRISAMQPTGRVEDPGFHRAERQPAQQGPGDQGRFLTPA